MFSYKIKDVSIFMIKVWENILKLFGFDLLVYAI